MPSFTTFLLPQEVSDARLDTILEIFDTVHHKKNIELDFSRLERVLPAGEAIFTCLIDKIIESKVRVKLTSIGPSINKLLIIQNLQRYVCHRGCFLDPQDLSYARDHMILYGTQETIAPGFVDKIDRLFDKKISETQRWYIRLIFNELMQNAVDHSTAERYFMYIGMYQDHIHFGITDLGVSVPAKMEQKYVCESDQAYLSKALEIHMGTRRTRPGGLGLHHMFEVLKEQKGRLVIVSRNAQVRRYFYTRKTDGGSVKHPLQGTWCFARMPLEKI